MRLQKVLFAGADDRGRMASLSGVSGRELKEMLKLVLQIPACQFDFLQLHLSRA